MTKKDTRSARELIIEIQQNIGLSQAEIASELQRDRRMVNKILRGETSGELYKQTLREIASTGKATSRPPRRRNSAGELVKVRAGAKGAPSKAPDETGGRYAELPKRGKFEKATTYLREGGRRYRIAFPKTKDAKGRAAGVAEILTKARQIKAQDTRWGERRVKFQVTYANGRMMELGAKAGYTAKSFLNQVKAHDGDALSWLTGQGKGRYDYFDPSTTPIVGVTMTVFASTQKEPGFENP